MVFKLLIKTGTIKATVNNCHFTQYYNEYFTQSKSQWLHGEHTHTICYQSTFLAGSKELNLVRKKQDTVCVHTVA